jgi:hypothetical protein
MARNEYPSHPEGAKSGYFTFVAPLLKVFLIIFGTYSTLTDICIVVTRK